MFRGDDLVGVFILYKLKVEPFTEKQIELVTTFADQAVIAIENARLLNELRQSLEQQTATSKVLQVISSATFDFKPVIDTARPIRRAFMPCGCGRNLAPTAIVLRMVAIHVDISNEFSEYARQQSTPITRASLSGRTILEGRTVHIPDDSSAEPEMTTISSVEVGKHRTALGVPISRKGEIIGVFALVRYEVRPFTDKQIELVTNVC